jgi:arylsulfatase
MFRGGRPIFHYNMANVAHYKIAAKDALTPGRHTIVFDFAYDGGGIGKGGTGTLSVDGRNIAEGRVGTTMPVRFSFDETFDVGEDTGTPVSEDYDVPFKFTGHIEKVVIKPAISKLTAAEQEKIQKADRVGLRRE